jgi:hypothetical protein
MSKALGVSQVGHGTHIEWMGSGGMAMVIIGGISIAWHVYMRPGESKSRI